jgi:hypothetical protein
LLCQRNAGKTYNTQKKDDCLKPGRHDRRPEMNVSIALALIRRGISPKGSRAQQIHVPNKNAPGKPGA